MPTFPELFRTDMTAMGEGAGWGFQHSALSPWFAFQDYDGGKWLKADKSDIFLMSLFNPKPGAWEKFKLERFREGDNVYFAFKTFHGKYVTCHWNTDMTVDAPAAENGHHKFIIFQKETGRITLFNPTVGKYISTGHDGRVRCDQLESSKATVWWSGANA